MQGLPPKTTQSYSLQYVEASAGLVVATKATPVVRTKSVDWAKTEPSVAQQALPDPVPQ